MSSSNQQNTVRRMPAEWAPHEATWLAWPHNETDWPGKIESAHLAMAQIIRVLAGHERVEILCHDDTEWRHAAESLRLNDVNLVNCQLHIVPMNRGWLRDSAPTAVRTEAGGIEWIDWRFNAWARYDDYQLDDQVPVAVARITGLNRVEACRPDHPDDRLVLEGGVFDTDGAGTLMVTEECLLSDEQVRNPGLSREDYERAFAEYLGIEKTIWLGSGCVADDTHGHIDDVARFVGPATVVLAYEPDPADENHEVSKENLVRLESATDAAGQQLRVVKLPMPQAVTYDGERLPASYANFYIANGVVIVPTFNDPNDRVAMVALARLFPDRQVVGIYARDLVWGQGTLHCATQQQPRE